MKMREEDDGYREILRREAARRRGRRWPAPYWPAEPSITTAKEQESGGWTPASEE